MKYRPKQHSPQLMAELTEFTEIRKAYAAGADALTINAIYTTYSTAKGISNVFRRCASYVDHGVSTVRYSREIQNVLATDLLPGLGLELLNIGRGASLVHDDECIVGSIEMSTNSSEYVEVFVIGIAEFVEDFKTAFKESFGNSRPPVVRRVVNHPQRGVLICDMVKLPPIKPSVGIDHLYPHHRQSPSQLWDMFSESDSNVMLLIGPPGTGKSSFIRAMMEHRGYKDRVYVVDREDVLKNPGLSDYIRSTPDDSLIIAEDADKLVMKRTAGNDVMSSLLNVSNGIIPTNKKIIISTNLPTTREVDEALLRPGRCFRVLTFDTLSAEEAIAARAAIDLPYIDLAAHGDKFTLAEALNFNEENIPNKPVFGFN